jgi:glutamate formiminotransferase/formiminotetrahydrofolate cyclodeaminase
MATPLTQLSLAEFAERTAAKEPTPGGGSVAAYIGAAGVALGVMAARFTEGRKGFEAHAEALARDIEGLEILRGQLTQLVEADALAYATVTGAYKLPKSTPEEKKARKRAIQEGLDVALDPPFRTCRAAVEGLELLSGLAQRSNPNLISDVAVAAFALGAAYRSAWINVLINLSGLKDEAKKASLLEEGAALESRCRELEDEVGGGITTKLST